MGQTVYMLCTLTSLGCTVLLWNRYRKSRVGLLFWSGMSFLAFTLTNIILFADFILVPEMDLGLVRNCTTLCGVAVLLYGLIHDHT